MLKSFFKSNYKWYILALAMVTYGWVTGAQRNCMPVLFDEISKDLNLNSFSIGTIWGMDPLAGVFVGLLGGMLVDRFGVRKTLTIACIFAGIFSAVRGLSVNFLTMAASMFLFGIVVAMMPSIVPKAAAIWFPSRQMGFINALINVSLSVFSMVATMLGATVLSPWLGGWRHVLYFLSVPTIIIGLLWLITGRNPRQDEVQVLHVEKIPLLQSLTHIVKIKEVWIIGAITFALWGTIIGLLGYLPMYLRGTGMSIALSDTAVTVVSAAGMLGSLPMVWFAHKFHAYKQTFFISMVVSGIGLGLIPLVNHTLLWPVLFISAFMRSSTTALANVMMLNNEKVGVPYIGTAMGLMSSLGMAGGAVAPALGNSLEPIDPRFPFFLWAGMAFLALPLFLLLKKNKKSPESGQNAT